MLNSTEIERLTKLGRMRWMSYLSMKLQENFILKNVIELKRALVPAIQQQTSHGLSSSNPVANKSGP
jgi:hypothetical protein